jgi:hypothetical protein
MPALLLGLVPGRGILPRKFTQAAPGIIGVGMGLVMVVYILGAYLSFYIVCGTSLYTPGLCYQPLYKNWTSHSVLTQPVTKEVVLQQKFLSVCSPLRSVRMWSAAPSPDAAGETRITLKDATDGTVLVEKHINNQTIANYAWVEVPFSPIEATKGKEFVLEITSDLSDPAAGIAFGVTQRREYRYGLIINNSAANFDLMFQYGCEPLNIINEITGTKKP